MLVRIPMAQTSIIAEQNRNRNRYLKANTCESLFKHNSCDNIVQYIIRIYMIIYIYIYIVSISSDG